MRTKSWRQGYSFYDNSEDAASARKPVAIYSQEGNASYKQQFVTTLRATHNIPRIGFVVTMTAQAIWQQSNWNTFGNDSIPVGYLACLLYTSDAADDLLCEDLGGRRIIKKKKKKKQTK